MALVKEIVIGQITILEDGQIQVQQITRIIEDGVELSHSYHRHVVAPGDSVADEDPRVQIATNAFHTPAVVAAFAAAVATRGNP